MTISDCRDCPCGHFDLSGPCCVTTSWLRKSCHKLPSLHSAFLKKNNSHDQAIFISLSYSNLMQLQSKDIANMAKNSEAQYEVVAVYDEDGARH